MKSPKILIIVCLLFTYFGNIAAQKTDLKPLYAQLRNAIDSVEVYDSWQQKKIDGLKGSYADATKKHDKRFKLQLCKELFQAYSKFCYDSALVYLNRGIELAEETGEKDKLMEMKLLQARYYGKGGSYVEAVQLINLIDESVVPEELLPLYYDAVRTIYVETGNTLRHPTLHEDYLSKSAAFRAKFYDVQDSLSLSVLALREGKARFTKNYDEALYCSDLQLKLVKPDSQPFSEVAFFRSCTYRDLGNHEMQKYWLLRSAIGDIHNSIKDQASLWSLAELLAEEGDTELSYLLIRTSHDGLALYNAPIRYLQSVNILSMIDHNYQIVTNDKNRKLRGSLWLISLLGLIVLCTTAYIHRQMKRLNVARLQLAEANGELKNLNNQLNSTIESLNISNLKLSESNTVKDVYIGRFLSLCSEYMKKMDSFRSTVLKKEKSGQLEEYLSKSRMREIKAQEVAEFTTDFDEAFLHIVPSFIEDFNALLKPEGRIVPKDEMTLTTELRIFALIRLGINDSSKIAEFLHYSVQTIYNYRSAVKNHAICDRDDFEDKVREIGTSKQNGE